MPSPSYVPVIATGRDITFQDATVEGDLSVAGASDFTGDVTTDSNLTVHGTLDVTGTTSLASVSEGDTTVGGTLTVTGNSDLQGLTVHQSASMNEVYAANMSVTQMTNSGNETIAGTLGVTGHTTLSTVATSGEATLASTAVTDNATVGGTLGVTGYTEMSSGQTSGAFNVFDGTAGALNLGTAGGGIAMKTGANARVGEAVLVAGTVTVANTSVTANTKIILSRTTLGGTPGHLSVAQTPATGFTINSSEAADTSTVVWLLIEVS